VGLQLGHLALHATGVQVVSVRQAAGSVVEPDEALVLGPGDTLVLSGLPEALSLAEAKLLEG
jgi:CPA2 family monovalent cation:H+ antiporter-2